MKVVKVPGGRGGDRAEGRRGGRRGEGRRGRARRGPGAPRN